MNARLEDEPIAELRRQIKQPTLLLMHVIAGRSILTVESVTKERFTFRFNRPDEQPGKTRPIWVNVLGGPDDRAWSFLGTIWPAPSGSSDPWTFRRSPKSKVDPRGTVFRACQWIAERLPQRPDELMEKATWWHEGRCGRCARRLTVPESIESGFGPECSRILGLS